MKIEDGKRILEPGDRIYCRGIIVTIKEIDHQDDFGSEGFDIEFYDRKGSFRSWKQRFDGGFVLNDELVSTETIQRVRDYFDANLPQYNVLVVNRASEHPEDKHLYIVIAIKKGRDDDYAVWTAWNDSIQTLNYGHYGIATAEEAVVVYNEYFHKIRGRIGDK